MNNRDLTGMINGAVGRLVTTMMKIALSDFSAVPSLVNILRLQSKTSDIRARHEREGLHVPAFIIASIVRLCNLRCKGCYDRAKQDMCPSSAKSESRGVPTATPNESVGALAVSPELDAASWKRLFGEATELGVSFILLAGGEPLLRGDVIRECIQWPDIIFPVFTNGLLIDDEWLSYFASARNVIPVVSIEGDRTITDERRGVGVYDVLSSKIARLKQNKILYGCSITLTSENFDMVLSESYVAGLVTGGAKIFFFVEYVPFDEGTENLVASASQKIELPGRIAKLRSTFAAIFLDFPGDEAAFGGCLASGRGFVHINAGGDVESCPFAPYSDSSVASVSLRKAIASPTLERIRALQETLGHTGGCTLFENRDKVLETLALK